MLLHMQSDISYKTKGEVRFETSSTSARVRIPQEPLTFDCAISTEPRCVSYLLCWTTHSRLMSRALDRQPPAQHGGRSPGINSRAHTQDGGRSPDINSRAHPPASCNFSPQFPLSWSFFS
ncbi:hypothetical protein RRG08_067065 [Elysia crispata]|uniref:Uncharacterized protein n=1 Tax=Elysia crispata TaxID=231223 RepID=A0AAE1B7X5_9GAST|nr:hypothetical protein RRG08_067065 [Elysia crispata]